jgi:hypothetical protein
VVAASGDIGPVGEPCSVPPASNFPRSGRSTCPPPTRSCWPRVVPGWRPATKPAPTAARLPGGRPTEPREPRTRPPVAGSATGSPGPATSTACPASAPLGACPTWPPTPLVTPA